MKNWNTPAIIEVDIAATAHGFYGIHSDGNRQGAAINLTGAQSGADGCQNAGGDYGTAFGHHDPHDFSASVGYTS